MAFGTKQGSLRNLKKSLAKGGGKGFIKFIPKNGAMTVRFIQEPEEWVNYVEHYDQVARKSFPCSGESNCPGCVSGERKSSRYLANVVDRDDSQERVVPLQMPKDLANRIVIKYEKWGSITDRDIELSRSGEGLDTVYDLDAMAPDRKRIDKFQPIDLLKVLEDAFDAVFGDGDDDEEEEAPKPTRGRKKSAAAPKRGTTLDDDDDEEDEEEAPKPVARKRAARKTAAKAPDPEPDPEDDDEPEEEAPKPRRGRKTAAAKPPEPEFEPDDDDGEDPDADDEPDADDDPDDEDVLTEEELRAMSFGVLRATAREFGISTKGKKAEDIIEEILDSGDED